MINLHVVSNVVHGTTLEHCVKYENNRNGKDFLFKFNLNFVMHLIFELQIIDKMFDRLSS